MCTDSSGHIVAGAVSSLAAPAASSCAVRIAAHGDDHPIPVVGLEAEQVVLQAAHKKNMTLLQLLNLFFRMCAD
jgi:hypothetical protein